VQQNRETLDRTQEALVAEGARPFLEGHKRHGKKFTPPMAQLPGFSEVRWIDDLLPEFLWIGLSLHLHGTRRTFRLLEGLVEAWSSLDLESPGWLSRASTMSGLGLDARSSLAAKLEESGHLRDLRGAVGPLVLHYPECPLAALFPDAEPVGELDMVREGVAMSLNRWSEHATWIQVAAVYMVIGQGKLHFAKDSVLADFPEVQNYPRSDVSRMIASSCRALINSFPRSEGTQASEDWTTYFWARGQELDPCEPMEWVSDEDE